MLWRLSLAGRSVIQSLSDYSTARGIYFLDLLWKRSGCFATVSLIFIDFWQFAAHRSIMPLVSRASCFNYNHTVHTSETLVHQRRPSLFIRRWQIVRLAHWNTKRRKRKQRSANKAATTERVSSFVERVRMSIPMHSFQSKLTPNHQPREWRVCITYWLTFLQYSFASKALVTLTQLIRYEQVLVAHCNQYCIGTNTHYTTVEFTRGSNYFLTRDSMHCWVKAYSIWEPRVCCLLGLPT